MTCTCDLWPVFCTCQAVMDGWGLNRQCQMQNGLACKYIFVVLSRIMIGCSRSWSNIHVTYQRSQVIVTKKVSGNCKTNLLICHRNTWPAWEWLLYLFQTQTWILWSSIKISNKCCRFCVITNNWWSTSYTILQGWALRNIEGSPVLWTCKI